MVTMSARYSGGLHCEVTHGPSNSRIETDAPKDNNGKGERFSPTDLVGAALATCILTTVAIVAERDGVSIEGATAEVSKEMVSAPRRIGALPLTVKFPASVPTAYREKLEKVAHGCPVTQSIHPSIRVTIAFQYG